MFEKRTYMVVSKEAWCLPYITGSYGKACTKAEELSKKYGTEFVVGAALVGKRVKSPIETIRYE